MQKQFEVLIRRFLTTLKGEQNLAVSFVALYLPFALLFVLMYLIMLWTVNNSTFHSNLKIWDFIQYSWEGIYRI